MEDKILLTAWQAANYALHDARVHNKMATLLTGRYARRSFLLSMALSHPNDSSSDTHQTQHGGGGYNDRVISSTTQTDNLTWDISTVPSTGMRLHAGGACYGC
jgi:hypothetical protein